MSDARKDWEEAFDTLFWPEYYPLRKGLPNPKGRAKAIWMRVRDTSQENFDRIIEELRCCKADWVGKDRQYVPHAATWLGQRILAGVFYPSEAANGVD